MNSNIIHNFNPNIINNINPLIFGKMINFNNAQGMDFIHHNNMIINNTMDIIRKLTFRPNVDDQENLNTVNNIFEDTSLVGTTNRYISRLALIVGLLSVGVLGGN
jgi:hypothetical protein